MLLSLVTLEASLQLPRSQLELSKVCQKIPLSCKNITGWLVNPLFPKAAIARVQTNSPQSDSLVTHF